MALADRATMGGSVQLLRERLPLGPDVCAHVSVPALLCPGMPESASLAGQPSGGRKHRLWQDLQRLSEVRQLRPPAGTGRFAQRSRSADLRAEVAGRIHAFLQGTRT